jgi:hypothetical protein
LALTAVEAALSCCAVSGAEEESSSAERDLDGDDNRRMWVWNDNDVKWVLNEAGSGFVK